MAVDVSANGSSRWKATLAPDANNVSVAQLTPGAAYLVSVQSRSGQLVNQSQALVRTGGTPLPLLLLLLLFCSSSSSSTLPLLSLLLRLLCSSSASPPVVLLDTLSLRPLPVSPPAPAPATLLALSPSPSSPGGLLLTWAPPAGHWESYNLMLLELDGSGQVGGAAAAAVTLEQKAVDYSFPGAGLTPGRSYRAVLTVRSGGLLARSTADGTTGELST